MLEKTLEGPLDSKEIIPVNPKGNQPWVGKTDSEAPILWPPDAKSPLIGKDSDAGKDWRQEEKRVTEDERVEWHHWLKGHEFEQALGNSEGQGSLACCSAWGHKELDMTEQLNDNNQKDDNSPVGEGRRHAKHFENYKKSLQKSRVRSGREWQAQSLEWWWNPSSMGLEKAELRETYFCFLWQRGWWNNAEKEGAPLSDGGSWGACKSPAATLNSDLSTKWMMLQITGATWRRDSEVITGCN